MNRDSAVAQEQAIPRRAKSDPCPLSLAQQRLWFLDQLQPDSPLYRIFTAVRVEGTLDTSTLRRSLEAIVARHESLRTTFVAVDGNPRQVIAESQTVELPVMDLRGLPASDRAGEARRLATEEAWRPFDLARGPLWRFRLYRLGEAEYVLLLGMHQMVSDHWSVRVLFAELAALYQALLNGEPSPLPELCIQYGDVAIWQREWLQGEVPQRQLSYWKQQLSGSLPVLELPTDRPRPPVQSGRGARQHLLMPQTVTRALIELSDHEGATLFMTLLAAFQTLLHRYTGQDDIVVGSPIAGRNRLEIEGLIGSLANTLVLRTGLAGNPTLREVLGRVREVTLSAHAHADLPFEKLVEELEPERNLSRSPMFQMMFQMRNIPEKQPQLPGLKIGDFEIAIGVSSFDLSLEVAEPFQGLSCKFAYNTDLFESATMARMLAHFRTLLEGIVADPDRPVADLPLLSEAERRHLLV